MVIDFHTHVFPDKIAGRTIEVLEGNSNFKAAIPGTLDALLSSMERNAIDHSVVLPIATKPSQRASILRFAVEIDKLPNITSFGSVHPDSDDVKGDIRRIKEAGLKGIKLHPDYQGFFIDDVKAVRTITLAAEEDLTVIVHAGEDIAFPDVHHCTPQRIRRILPDIKGCRFVCAHLGGWRYWDDVERYLMDTDVYIDTCFTFGWCETEQIVRILKNFNPDRILFGTDSPWDDQGKAVEQLKSTGLPENLLRKILHQNAQVLLGMSSAQEK